MREAHVWFLSLPLQASVRARPQGLKARLFGRDSRDGRAGRAFGADGLHRRRPKR